MCCFGAWVFHNMMNGTFMARLKQLCSKTVTFQVVSFESTHPPDNLIGREALSPLRRPSLRRDMSFVVLFSTANFTNPMGKRGQSQLSIQKNGCSRPEHQDVGRPAGHAAMFFQHLAFLGMSPWPQSDCQSAVWEVVSRRSHTQEQERRKRRVAAALVFKGRPGPAR